jgi:choline-sulfatase
MSADRPNVLIAMSDQHSPRLLGCYGNGVVRTPNLDRLAGGGVRFTDCYCPSPLCVPSRMSFMTARTPSRNRVWDNAHVLSSAIPTWPHYLGAAGYETALIGRMHFVGADQRHGFEKRPLGEFGACHPGAPVAGGEAYTRVPVEGCSQDRRAVEVAGTGTTIHEWFDRRVAEETVNYLREKAARPGGRPFAAVAGFVLPHNPYVAPRELLEYYLDRVDLPVAEEEQPASTMRHRRKRGYLDPEPIPAERVRLARAAYFALCELYDSILGRVLDALDETGLADNTLLIYCSDHGDMAGEHGLWCKSCYYQASAGVPLIARLPGTTPEGTTCDRVCNLMDLGPTLCELAGAGPMLDVDGSSLLPLVRGETPADWPDETFSELADLDSWPRRPDGGYQASRMVRSGKWKLWLDADGQELPPVLFDLEEDPDETRDLAGDEAHAALRDELLGKVSSGWDPKEVSRASAELAADRQVLRAWAREVKPPTPDALAVPRDWNEGDVQIL